MNGAQFHLYRLQLLLALNQRLLDSLSVHAVRSKLRLQVRIGDLQLAYLVLRKSKSEKDVSVLE